MQRIRVIDSHTGGEPTRLVTHGLPDLGPGSIAQRLLRLRSEFDAYRMAVIGEPRSSPVAVGAYLLPSDSANFGVIFFNPAGYLGMCGHGTIGLVATLRHMGKVGVGSVSVETPVGIVEVALREDGTVAFDNVPSFRYLTGVAACGATGDVAYGGNWFFISSDHPARVDKENIEELTRYTWEIRRDLARQGVTGEDGAEIDHVELIGPSETADARNFVHCPGGEYDRSPCGTGTSAKLACLFADGKLAEGQIWRQESIIGSVFEGSVRRGESGLIPTVAGRAFVNGESELLIDPADPFAWGVH